MTPGVPLDGNPPAESVVAFFDLTTKSARMMTLCCKGGKDEGKENVPEDRVDWTLGFCMTNATDPLTNDFLQILLRS